MTPFAHRVSKHLTPLILTAMGCTDGREALSTSHVDAVQAELVHLRTIAADFAIAPHSTTPCPTPPQQASKVTPLIDAEWLNHIDDPSYREDWFWLNDSKIGRLPYEPAPQYRSYGPHDLANEPWVAFLDAPDRSAPTLVDTKPQGGWLTGRIVIVNQATGALLCQAPVSARNGPTDEEVPGAVLRMENELAQNISLAVDDANQAMGNPGVSVKAPIRRDAPKKCAGEGCFDDTPGLYDHMPYAQETARPSSGN